MAATEPSERRMANDIAVNLAHLPAGRAAAELAGHISRFWDPRMRTRLCALADGDAPGMHPLVIEAVKLLR
ncbi:MULTISPECIES: formate dehydrogenase subunit delta [unclassified Streptomyces]|uniref:Formate dehydrogenase subunit delta n=1 Tax=Streptomyces sp. NBC_00119 TaxID=2975659 RepID=A0AAU1U4E4_9ACTN|nr:MULTISPECIES: formate dehydrogenase subunit delta [unclassified Streptomyces]MCX4641704.1 formate dehydrogenase subunit delta [Streptomyces sp. NBC_01446]MCX5321883.1 formate dehydrogenase subunit delta [Streptomyces sp. NBC_00120]